MCVWYDNCNYIPDAGEGFLWVNVGTEDGQSKLGNGIGRKKEKIGKKKERKKKRTQKEKDWTNDVIEKLNGRD